MEKSFKKLDVVKIAIKLSSLNILILLIGLLKNKISAVFLGSQSYGYLGLTLSIIGFSYIFTSFGSNREMVYRISRGDTTYTSQIIFPQIIISLIFGIIIALFLMINQNISINFFQGLLIPILVITNTLNLTYFQYLRALREIRKYSRLQLSFNFLFVISYYFFFKSFDYHGILPSLVVVNVFFFCAILLNDEKFRNCFKSKIEFKSIDFKTAFPYLINDIINLSPFLLIQLIIGDNPELLSSTVLLLAILNQYFGAFFKGINTDFYPRLTQTFKISNKGANELINYQASLNIIIVSLVTIFINSFTKFFIVFISSEQFLEIESSIRIICVIVLIRTISNSFGQCFPSKGDKYSINMNDILFSTIFFISFFLLKKTIENIALGLLLASIIHLLSTMLQGRKKHGVFVNFRVFIFFIINLTSSFLTYLSKKLNIELLTELSILITFISTLILFIYIYKISKNEGNLLSG